MTIDMHAHDYDCASPGPRGLEIAVKAVGADRLMPGTACPVFEPANAAACVSKAELSDADKAAILGATARKLIAAFG